MIIKEVYYNKKKDSNNDPSFSNTKNISPKTLYFDQNFNQLVKEKLEIKPANTTKHKKFFTIPTKKSEYTNTESSKEKVFARKSLFNFKLRDLLKKDIEEITKKEHLYIPPKTLNQLKRDLNFQSTLIIEFLDKQRY